MCCAVCRGGLQHARKHTTDDLGQEGSLRGGAPVGRGATYCQGSSSTAWRRGDGECGTRRAPVGQCGEWEGGEVEDDSSLGEEEGSTGGAEEQCLAGRSMGPSRDQQGPSHMGGAGRRSGSHNNRKKAATGQHWGAGKQAARQAHAFGFTALQQRQNAAAAAALQGAVLQEAQPSPAELGHLHLAAADCGRESEAVFLCADNQMCTVEHASAVGEGREAAAHKRALTSTHRLHPSPPPAPTSPAAGRRTFAAEGALGVASSCRAQPAAAAHIFFKHKVVAPPRQAQPAAVPTAHVGACSGGREAQYLHFGACSGAGRLQYPQHISGPVQGQGGGCGERSVRLGNWLYIHLHSFAFIYITLHVHYIHFTFI